MTIEEMIAVLQAAKEGKKIRFRNKGREDWYNIDNTVWNFEFCEYEAVKEPRHFWINIYPNGDRIAYPTKENADLQASTDRLECIEVVEVLK